MRPMTPKCSPRNVPSLPIWISDRVVHQIGHAAEILQILAIAQQRAAAELADGIHRRRRAEARPARRRRGNWRFSLKNGCEADNAGRSAPVCPATRLSWRRTRPARGCPWRRVRAVFPASPRPHRRRGGRALAQSALQRRRGCMACAIACGHRLADAQAGAETGTDAGHAALVLRRQRNAVGHLVLRVAPHVADHVHADAACRGSSAVLPAARRSARRSYRAPGHSGRTPVPACPSALAPSSSWLAAMSMKGTPDSPNRSVIAPIDQIAQLAVEIIDAVAARGYRKSPCRTCRDR